MLDPRIYRTGIIAVALAVIVFAFSLETQPGGPGSTLAPDAFNPQNAQSTLSSLLRAAPDRRPGSSGDARVADDVAGALRGLGYSITRDTFTAATPEGRRTLVNVTGTLAGQSSDTILVVSHRDALTSPAAGDLSGTAVMLELARVLGGETAYHTIVFASVSGSAGSLGAAELARTLPGPLDAVIVLGDLIAAHPRPPLVVPWSRGQSLASPALRNTLSSALGSQAGLAAAPPGIGGQLMHLAFPMTLTEQAPFDQSGASAVLLTLSGERARSGSEATDVTRLGPIGRSVLQSLNALNAGADVGRPSAYLVFSGKLIPGWAVRLLVLALIAPVLLTSFDGLARARRRGHRVVNWMAWVLCCALAFVLAWAIVLGAHLVGALSSAPGGPVPAGVAAPHTGGIVTLGLAAVVVLLGLGLLAPRLAGRVGVRLSPADPGAGAAAGVGVSMVLAVVSLAMWVVNPYAAVLLVPALHVWMWLGCVQVPIPRPVKLLGVLVGVVPAALAVLYYAMALRLSPIGVLWNGVLMIISGQIGPAVAVLWSIVFGCFAGMVVLVLRGPRRAREEAAPITVRGPVTYAGPGSLGGTGSALRR
jgi:hypothetical protein